MSILEARPLEAPEIIDAVTHYIECLNLSEQANVVIITDKPSLADPSEDRKMRIVMAKTIRKELIAHNTQNAPDPILLQFDNEMTETEMYDQTKAALESFHSLHPATIVYLGDSWTNRNGIYQAAGEQSRHKQVRVAGSLGFKTGDIRVMSQMTTDRRKLIEQTNTFFEEFFDEHPKGTFVIETTTNSGTFLYLGIPYDISQAPFISSLGILDERTHISSEGFRYTNIPSGETFGVPYSFEHAFGMFMAQGIEFTIYDGMVEKYNASPEVLEKITNRSQIELLALLKKGVRVPIAELGLGFYSLANIDVFTDSSIVSLEKAGPHAGMGKTVSPSTQAGEIDTRAGNFHHTDFVMDGPRILHHDFYTKKESQFYPPQS